MGYGQHSQLGACIALSAPMKKVGKSGKVRYEPVGIWLDEAQTDRILKQYDEGQERLCARRIVDICTGKLSLAELELARHEPAKAGPAQVVDVQAAISQGIEAGLKSAFDALGIDKESLELLKVHKAARKPKKEPASA